MKNVKKFNIRQTVEDIVSIQQYQAQSKKIKMKTKMIGFPPKVAFKNKHRALSKDVPMDE